MWQTNLWQATFLNDVFTDPLLQVDFRQKKRSFLFDLGASPALTKHTILQVSDVFITHAHIDHLAGFLQFLRHKITNEAPKTPLACRFYGPAGLAQNLIQLLNGILWDRIGEQGPVFAVQEVATAGDGLLLSQYLMQAGKTTIFNLPAPKQESSSEPALLLDEEDLQVKAIVLDHQTPVLAYALTEKARYRLNVQALDDLKLPKGPWLQQLKALALQESLQPASLTLEIPRETDEQLPQLTYAVKELKERLLQQVRGAKLVYATDFKGNTANIRKLSALAAKADILFCESCYLDAEAELAHKNQHLTTSNTREIALQAQVKNLYPFHFSRRYQHRRNDVYQELQTGLADIHLLS